VFAPVLGRLLIANDADAELWTVTFTVGYTPHMHALQQYQAPDEGQAKLSI